MLLNRTNDFSVVKLTKDDGQISLLGHCLSSCLQSFRRLIFNSTMTFNNNLSFPGHRHSYVYVGSLLAIIDKYGVTISVST